MTKTTYKVGDKVRILDAKKIWFGTRYWKDGDDTEVIRLLDDGRPCLSRNTEDLDERGLPLWSSELQYIELISPKPTKNQRLTSAEQAISTLEQKVEAMQAEIEAIKAAQKPKSILSGEGTLIFDGKPIAKVSGISYKTMTTNEQASANEKRKAIIDEAKAFLEEVEREQNDSKVRDRGNAFHRQYLTKTEFIVNAEKRTVVAIIRTKYGTTLLTKAIAKCNPSDVFNEHIGKAIALGRALGLDVSKFEKAVHPSEVVVGMVVNRVNIDGDDLGPLKVETVRKLGERDYKTYKTNTHEINESFGYGVEHGDKIIDDTEAQY